MEWKRGVSQHGSATSMEEGSALIWRSEGGGHLLVALEWCLHMKLEVGVHPIVRNSM